MKKNTTDYNPEITKEDKQILGDKKGHLRPGKGQDLELQNRKHPFDFSGNDLDIPGRKIVDKKSGKVLKDEENQLYSQGSSENEHLEQTQDPMN